MARYPGEASYHPSLMLQEVLKYHEEGNEAFRNRLYQNAKVKYSSALDLLHVISKSFSWDPLIMNQVMDKEMKLLSNLSKAHRHLGQFMEAIKQACFCVTRYPNYAKGHYCLAEALRDSLPPDPVYVDDEEAQETLRNAVMHFAAAFRSTNDKQAFLECALIAITEKLTDLLPALPEMEKKSILQHTLEAILTTQLTPDLETYLQFFFVQGDNTAQLPCRPGCAIGLVSFQHCHILADVYPFLQQHLVEVLIRHGMPVDVNVIVKMLNDSYSRQLELIKVMFPALPASLVQSANMRKVLEVAIRGRHFGVLLYLCQQGVHFHPDIVALVMKQQGKSSTLAELKSRIAPLSVGNLEKAVKLREEGTAAYKRKDFVTARKCYCQALVLLDRISTTESKFPHAEERQKLLGNLSGVDRNLKDYRGSISWAKSLIDRFPDNPKGYFRRAEAYRENAAASKGEERKALRILAVEDFAKAFQISRESHIYVECVFLAVVADAVHLVPAIKPAESVPLGRITLDYLLKSTKQEDVAKFITEAVALSPSTQSQIAFPFCTDLAKSVSLSDLPSHLLSLQCMKHLIDNGVQVTYPVFEQHLLKSKEESSICLLSKLSPSALTPQRMTDSLIAAVRRRFSTVLDTLLDKGALFPPDKAVRQAVLDWDISILSTAILKAALQRTSLSIAPVDRVVFLLNKRLKYVEEKATENQKSGASSKCHRCITEAVDCCDGIKVMEGKLSPDNLKKTVYLLNRLATLEFAMGRLTEARQSAERCLSLDPDNPTVLTTLAAVMGSEAKTDIFHIPKAKELFERGFHMHLKAFNEKGGSKENFLSLLVMAVARGPALTAHLPDLGALSRSLANELLVYAVRCLLDKSYNYEVDLVRNCIVFMLVPKRYAYCYGKGLVNLKNFTLSRFIPYLGWNALYTECLLLHKVVVDAPAIVACIKDLAVTRKSEMPEKRALCLRLCKECHTNNTNGYLKAAIEVKDGELVEHMIRSMRAQLDEDDLKAVLEWGKAHLTPSCLTAIVGSQNPPLHVRNSRNETALDVAQRYNLPALIRTAELKCKNLPSKSVKLSVDDAIKEWPSVELLQSMLDNEATVTLKALQSVYSCRRHGNRHPTECREVAELICSALPREVFKSAECEKLLSRCINDNYKELAELLLNEGVAVSENDAKCVLSGKAKNIPPAVLKALVKSDLKTRAKQSTVHLMVQVAMNIEAFEVLDDLMPFSDSLPPCSLSNVMFKCPQIKASTLAMMIDKGATLSSVAGSPPALVQTKKLLKEMDVKKAPREDLVNLCKIFVLLLKNGADVHSLTDQEINSPTPVHVATALALHTGCAEILQSVLDTVQAHDGKQITNSLGQTPLHEVAKHKNKPTDEILRLLLDAGINPRTKDKKKNTALEMVKGRCGKEITVDKLKNYESQFDSSRKSKSKKKSSKKKIVECQSTADITTAHREDSKESKLTLDQDQTQVKSSAAVRLDTLNALVKSTLQLVGKHDFKEPVALPSNTSKDNHVDEESGSELLDQDSEEDDEVESVQIRNLDNAVVNSQEDQNLPLPSEPDFDGLTWEVDCTERFWKSLSRLSEPLRQKAIGNICRLASGEWHPKFHKSVSSMPDLELFEMRLTKDRRVLWQKAIDFSPRCSTDSQQVVYSEIIRLWDLVKHKGIQPCIEYVEQSFSKGRDSHVKHLLKNLQGYSSPAQCLSPHKSPHKSPSKSPYKSHSMRECVPKLYVCSNEKQDTGPQYTPAATPGQLDYNVITFYAFSTAMVHSVLCHPGKRYDFPFKGWPKEHDIINLEPGEPILLLGRSGTGKTTCCVYRLWNQCNNYWSQAVEPYIQRVPLLFTRSIQQGNEGTTDESKVLPVREQGLENLPSADPGTVSSSATRDTVTYVDPAIVEQEDWYGGWQQQVRTVRDSDATSSSANVDEESTVEPVTDDSTTFDHLQQIFITKNPVLVSQVHKKFYDLASSSPHMSNHLEFENTTLPSRFQEVPPRAYPLFVTSFQWLNMVDASLTAGSSMFPRDDKGKLQVELVDSGGEFSATTDDLELFDESESESDEVDEDSTVPHATAEHATSVKRQRVVDSSYFCHPVWQQITRTEVNLRKKYDPLLVWMEIRSFLKGSYECLMIEDGKMTLQQYKSIGAKRAGNFTGDRDEVFSLFELYQKYLIQHDLVDQCDWVHNIFWRLKQQKEVGIVIHEIYIDEVQDFTQAELYLILHCCRCPNVGLFLTGDTAQSIMKGIAFRFQDLRSLFYHFRDDYLKEDKAKRILKVPKMNQLTQNFRSHSGILEVASTVIQVLQHFFPSSIDTLPEDRGLFSGPLPIVLHSISESDLAIILRGNRRESVTIEFGAHQAVLVQTEEAKQSLPDELSQAIVLTVFEAKGLEFDDVLLYNFFADSKADQEWRLALEHLSNSGTAVSADEFPFLDKTVLRPLEFDEKLHRSFSAELKYLYTAITRAKCNLWIYDTNPARFSPLVYVLLKLKLVSAVSLNDISQEDVTTVFVKESSSDEWLDRGRYFLKKKLWEPARTCFHKGGNDVLAMEAEARSLISKAKSTDKGRVKARHELFQSAAILFLQCASSSDSLDLTYLKYAAAYLHLGQQWEQAGQVFESISEWTKAFKSYHKAKNFSKASAMKEKLGQYNESLLYLRNAGMYPLALKTALKYRKDNVFIEGSSISVEDLAYQTAKHHKSRQEYDNMYECVRLLPGIDDQIRLLKSAGEYDQVVKLCVSENMVEEAYKILAARGRFVEGRQLALSRNNGMAALKFLLMEARSLEVVRLSVSDICSGLYLQLSEEEHADRLSDLRGTLYDLIGRMTTVIEKWHLVHKYPTLVLEKALLEAVCHYDVGKLQLRGRKVHNVFAQMERVRLLVNLTPLEASLDRIPVKELHLSSQQLLEKLPTLVTLRDNPADLSQESTELLSQVEEWYGLRCDPPQYSVLPQQDLWLRFSRQAGKISFAVNLILDHLYASVKKWLGISRKIINSILESDKFAGYKEVATCNNLAQAQKLEPRVLKEYIELLCLAVKVEITDRDALLMDVAFNIKDRDAALIAAFEKLSEDEVKITMKKCSAKSKSHLRPTILKQCSGKQGFEYLRNLFPRLLTDLGQSSCRTLVKYFSPVVACHAPLSGMHYRALCASSAVHECVLSYGNLSTRALTDINAFMTVWWMRGGDRLRDMLNKCEHKGALSDFFIFDRQLKREIHFFMIWIWACSKQQEPMTFCKTAIYRFTRYIAKRKGVKKLNPANMLPLLELLSTTLIGMLVSLEDCIRGHRTGFMACLPKRYEHVVQLFGDASWTTNTRRGDNHLLDKVYTSMAEGGNPQGLLGEARSLLVELADIFFGLSAYRGFKVLEYVLDGEDNISNGLLQRAFELSAVLLANLEFFAGRECLKYRMEFLDVIRSSSEKRFARHQSADLQQGEAAYSMCGHVYSSVEKASSTLDLVSFMSSLCGGRGVSMLRVDQQKWTVYFAPLQSLESYKPVLFHGVPAMLPTPPSPSKGSTPWPEWSEGEAFYPTQPKVPQESSFERESSVDAYEEEGFDGEDGGEQDSFFLDTTQVNRSEQVERYFEQDDCLACGITMKETCEDSDGDPKIQHVDGALHISNAAAFDQFKEKTSESTVLKGAMTALQQSKAVQDRNLDLDRAEDSLKQSVDRLKKTQGALPEGVRDAAAWRRHCQEFEAASNTVAEVLDSLKHQLNTHVKSLKDSQSLISLQTDDENDDDVLPDEFEQTVEDQPVKKKKSRYRRKTRNR